VGLEELVASVVRVPFLGAEVLLIRGVMGPVMGSGAAKTPELMRGEETAAMGILDDSGAGLVCFPGTHSKWIQLSDRKIVSFTTSMTGDVYSALSKCTILERTMTSGAVTEEAAFREGVNRSADSGGLLHHLFGVRTLVLMGQLKEEASASYLSGLLIGHEVRAAMPTGARVMVVGAAQLCGLYAQAIEACGGRATLADEDAAALGLAAIGRRLGWT
jgi:2-dehydro-3-deoxygalactonokinase